MLFTFSSPEPNFAEPENNTRVLSISHFRLAYNVNFKILKKKSKISKFSKFFKNFKILKNISKISNKGLGAIRAKIGPTSDVDKKISKMYSQYVFFINKYS
jgi:hypothetical protein